VLNAGKIEQYGSPLELYERPTNLFVAGFIGSPKMNLITGEPAARRGATTIGVRPEHFRVDADGEGWPGKVVIAEHLGSDTFLYVDAGPLGTLTVRGAGEIGVKMGDTVRLSPDPNRVYRFDANGNAIHV
jgi:multiple sugar transport system ATP-binding protein